MRRYAQGTHVPAGRSREDQVSMYKGNVAKVEADAQEIAGQMTLPMVAGAAEAPKE